MQNIMTLLDMGGYGIYVWPTYFITFFVFGINLIMTLREKRRVKNRLHRFHLEMTNTS